MFSPNLAHKLAVQYRHHRRHHHHHHHQQQQQQQQQQDGPALRSSELKKSGCVCA
jgi:hypothetical protein